MVEDIDDQLECDIAIVGSGIGGATLAWALRDSGARILVLERGDFLRRERENWSARDVHLLGRYKNSDPWIDAAGREFLPGNYHYVGGSSKFYGATMPRLRETDFGAVRTHDGTSPAWPIQYGELEPFYCQAEELYWVHGDGGDPTEPWRSRPYPFPPVPHEPPIAAIADGFRRQGLQPFALPQAVDSRPGGRCVLCRTCDSYVCLVDAKGDADVAALRPALRSPNVRILTRADVRKVIMAPGGSSIAHLEVRHDARKVKVVAPKFAIAAGAVNTAALLLRSLTTARPNGVANSSGMLGRNYMAHVCTFVVGVRPGHEHHLVYEKTLGLNDWYHAGPTNEYPLGNVQALGKLQGATIKRARAYVPLGVLEWMTRRSVDFFAETEDLPRQDNRVFVDDRGRVHLHWKPTNLEPHRELVSRTSRALRRCGYPLIFTQQLGIEATSHQCGTARMGDDPTESVVNKDGRAHDVSNLWIVDGSVFPSSAAVNPGLTIAANALRVATSEELTN